MGHALVIPLWDTIRQIKFAFNAKFVRLPQEAKFASASTVEPRSHRLWNAREREREQIAIEFKRERRQLRELEHLESPRPRRCSPRPRSPEPPMTEAFCTGPSTSQPHPSQAEGSPVVEFPQSSLNQIFHRPASRYLPDDVLDGPVNSQCPQNLVEFWDTTRPPTTATDSLMFWKSLSRLAGALHFIHHTCPDSSLR